METSTDYSTIKWPSTYSYEDFTQALMQVAETKTIKESDRISKFESMVAKATGSSESVRMPEPFNRISYFTKFNILLNQARSKIIKEIYASIKNELNKLAEFATSIASHEPVLKEIIEEESSPMRKQFYDNPQNMESALSGLYNLDKTNATLFTDRFNRIKYGIECFIWGNELDKEVFNGDKDGAEIQRKFEMLQQVGKNLKSRDKEYLKSILRNIVGCIVALFMVRRTNINFGNDDCAKLTYYYKPMKIVRLKELVVFDKNPFMKEDGTEVDEKTEKDLYERMKRACDYDNVMAKRFGQYIINSSSLKPEQ